MLYQLGEFHSMPTYGQFLWRMHACTTAAAGNSCVETSCSQVHADVSVCMCIYNLLMLATCCPVTCAVQMSYYTA